MTKGWIDRVNIAASFVIKSSILTTEKYQFEKKRKMRTLAKKPCFISSKGHW